MKGLRGNWGREAIIKRNNLVDSFETTILLTLIMSQPLMFHLYPFSIQDSTYCHLKKGFCSLKLSKPTKLDGSFQINNLQLFLEHVMRIKLDNHEMLQLHISGSFPRVMCIEISMTQNNYHSGCHLALLLEVNMLQQKYNDFNTIQLPPPSFVIVHSGCSGSGRRKRCFTQSFRTQID